MDRTANYTIAGFNYQHCKSIYEILNSSNSKEIVLEGIIEDIDVYEAGNITAIQCKYYESKTNITPSGISKAIFDMINNYIKNDKIKFKLYIHINGIEEEEKFEFNLSYFNKVLDTCEKSKIKKYFSDFYEFPLEINKILKQNEFSKNDLSTIKEYIKLHENEIIKFNKEDFVSKVEIIKAVNYEHLYENTIECIIKNGFTEEESRNIIYPNFFQRVAEISSFEDVQERKLNCKIIKEDVFSKKSLIYTKWLDSLLLKKDYKKIIKKELTLRMQNNSSFRIFAIDLRCFDIKELALFIKKVKLKYYKKPKLNQLPLFVFDDENEDKYNELQNILYDYDICVENGEVGRKFNINKLMSDSNNKIKFCINNEDINKYIKEGKIKYDDAIIMGNKNEIFENIFIIPVKIVDLNINDLFYIFSLGGNN